MNGKRRRFALHRFHAFLKILGRERLVKGVTVNQWWEAIAAFGPVLTESEMRDLRCVEIKDVSGRYVALLVARSASITPWRILKTENLLAEALGEFIAFAINPTQYRRDKTATLAEMVAA